MQKTVCNVILGLLAGARLLGQQPSALDRPLPGDVRVSDPRVHHSCTSGETLDHLSRAVHVLVGFENLPNCPPGPRTRSAGDTAEVLTGLSVRQALDQLVSQMPQFAWKEVDGVVVVRPVSAWANPNNLLNQPVRPFAVVEQPADAALHALLQAGALLKPHEDVARSGVLVDSRLSVTFDGGTLMDALDAYVRAHGNAAWRVGYTNVVRL